MINPNVLKFHFKHHKKNVNIKSEKSASADGDESEDWLMTYIIHQSLFVCPIITLEPRDRFAINCDWRTPKSNRNVHNLIFRFVVEWFDFYSENLVSKLVICIMFCI